MIREFLAKVTDTVIQPETQASVTTGAGLAYYLTLNNIIGGLTVVLLVGQLGLVYLKYRDRHRAKKYGTKE
jgi:hypothetical protein